MTCNSDQRFIPEIVSCVAAGAPSRAALVEQDTTLDYGSLNSRANQVARYLLSRGVKAEDKIGISIGRSVNFAVAALGILKSGAAYVALDPSYPEARRKLIALDAGLLLSFSDHETAETSSFVQTVSLHDPEIQTQALSDLPLPSFGPEQLAYVIYTSGSTGVPKGVEVTHANLRHLVRWHSHAFQITADDRSTLIANVGFDAAVWELWPYMCAGATVFIPQPETIRQPEALRDYILQADISIMFAPTLLAEALIQAAWPQSARLQRLLTGGDTLRISPRPALPFSVINNYGPAECTVVSTSGEVPRSELRPAMPSIGRAIDGARVYLLDDQLQEVPAGAQGEICIAGSGVARGYLNQPELTSQRFVIHDNVRMYRSGDLGCLNADGSIQFLGRVDGQVKIRGYRIECGEIESALNSLPAVRTSAVVVREQRAGHRSLTAYLVPHSGAALSHDELRQNLRLLLPEYMVPEQFVRLDHLPLNENGKIDRNNLPAPTDETIIASAELPASPVESGLMTILTDLLGVDHIARNDDFFLLGGHSFIAAQVIARIRDRFGVELGLRAVFENPTVAGMAQQIEQRIVAGAASREAQRGYDINDNRGS
ncbi:MAG: amino acid adenylation domain-containing protein [Acidobacteriota bacterium]|nr:amino acid adenylation domain-containing protein [Acidobacteriota bacterium]